MRTLVVAITVLCGGLQAAAQQSGRLKMWADRAVSRAEVPGAVVVYLQNTTLVPLQTSLPWRVVRDGQTVASFPSSTVRTILGWEVRAFVWNKKDQSGKWAKSGSYTIEVGPISLGSGKWEKPAVTVAVTGTGWVATGSWFPLTKGNLWKFRGPGGAIEYQRVEQESLNGWMFLRNAPAGTGWVAYDGFPRPMNLYAYEGRSMLLFAFAFPVGTTWETGFSTIKRLRIGDFGLSLVTPAGGFVKVVRIDVLESAGPVKYGSFWFADGVGTIAYSKVTPSGTKMYRLWEAMIWSTESKKWYTLRGY